MALSFSTVGHYQLKHEIVSGATATVYAAYDQLHDTQALFHVLNQRLPRDPSVRTALIHAANDAKALVHPNVLQVFEAGAVNDRLYVATEAVDGDRLDRVLAMRKPPFEPVTLVDLVAELADGIDYAHAEGFIHGHITEEAIWLTGDGQHKIAFLGMGRAADAPPVPRAPAGITAYDAPEEVIGQPATEASDIYSLGAAAYLLGAGQLPFDYSDPAALERAILYELPSDADTLNPALPAGMTYALNRVLAKAPAIRYDNAQAFSYALEEGLTWAPSQSDQQVLRIGLASRIEAPTPAADLPQRRSRAGLGLLLAALAAIAGIFLIMSNGLLPLDPQQPGLTVTATTGAVAVVPAGGGESTPSPTDAEVAMTVALSERATITPTPTILPTEVVTPVQTAAEVALEAATEAVSGTASGTEIEAQAAEGSEAGALPANRGDGSSATTDGTATATNTQRPTATNRPTQTVAATATPRPSATATDRPTTTATSTRAATATATATATLRPTRTPTPTPVPTQTPTVTPAATATPRPTATAANTPFLPTATPQDTSPTSLPPPPGAAISALEPLDSSLTGRRAFSWQPSGLTLEPNQYYELIFWPIEGDPMADGFGPVGSIKETSVLVDLEQVADRLPQLERNRNYYWGVLLVELEPYRRIMHLGTGNQFLVPGGGGGGGNDGGDDCPGCGGRG